MWPVTRWYLEDDRIARSEKSWPPDPEQDFDREENHRESSRSYIAYALCQFLSNLINFLAVSGPLLVWG